MKNLSEIKACVIYNAVLVSILILYGFFGAFVVKKLEAHASGEILNGAQEASKQKLLEELWSRRNLEFHTWSTIARQKLDSYEKDLLLQSPSVSEWNLADAWLFACTIFTTVGYGNIAPITTAGRLFCILYALIGIPLFSVIASSLASLVTNILQLLHAANQRRLGATNNKKKEDGTQATAEKDENEQLVITVWHILTLNVAYLALGAVLFSLGEHWSLFESFYYCFVTLTTIGLGDYVPQNIHHTVSFGGFILIGLVLVMMLLGAIEEAICQRFDKIKQRFLKVADSKKDL